MGSAQQQLLAAQLAAAAVGNGGQGGATTTQAPSVGAAGPVMGQLGLNPLAGIGPQLGAPGAAQTSVTASPGMLFLPRLP